MISVVRAEWTKLRTVASTAWLLFAAVATTIAIGAAVTSATTTRDCPTPSTCFEDLTKLSLTGVQYGQAAVVVLAVLVMTDEYGTRSISVTLTAVPRRWKVFASKAAVVTGAVLVIAALSVLGSLLVGRLVLPGNGFGVANGYRPLSLGDEPTLRAAYGSVLYLALVALLSLGVATVLRDTAGSITVMLMLLYTSPVLTAFVTDPRWLKRLEKFSPMSAGLKIQATIGLDKLAIGPWAGLGVLAAWAGGALALGMLALRYRDA